VTGYYVRITLGIPRSKNQWILTLMGASVIVACGVPLAQGVFSLSWPKVEGVITHSRDRAGYRVIGVDLGYRYSTHGETYTGNRFRFQFVLTARHMRSRDVRSILGRYQPGEPVKVAVNPDNPADSVLEPGPDFESMIPFLLGFILLLLGLGDVRKNEAARKVPPWPLPARPRYGLAKTLAFCGVGLFLLGAYYLYQGISSTRWPSVGGRILFSHARGGPHPETLLWYEYHVDKRRYVASNYRNGGNVTPFLKVADAAAKRYPAGRAVPVYYNPRNPQDALLEPGLWWGNFVTPALAVVLLGAAWLAKRYAEIMASRKVAQR
jgi:Protein of unknown function (DUF3592)